MLREGELLGGRYRLIKRLGAGGMGEVWEALHEGLGRNVALKVLLPALVGEPELVARFQREARAAASLGHPNIVQVTDFAAAPGEPAYLVMELLSGQSLARAMEDGPMSEARVASIASQILTALDVAHRANIVHRDIKPDNIFLTNVGGAGDVVKVLDFGIAKLYGESEASKLTQTGMVMGTPQYMSPEQARGRPVDARTDLYAVGTCMYQALTGRLPFNAGSFNALLFAIAEEAPPPVSMMRADVDPRLGVVIERALSKDPALRFATAMEMRAALEPWTFASKPVSIVPSTSTLVNAPTVAATPALPLARATNNGSRVGLFAAIAVVALGGAGAIFYFVTGHSDQSPTTIADKKAPTKKKEEPPAKDHEEPVAPDEPTAPKPPKSPPAASTGKAPLPAAPSASVPSPSKPPTGARVATLSSISTHTTYGAAHVRSIATAKMADVNRCYALAEFDAVPHEFMSWSIMVMPDGKILSVTGSGSAPRSQGLDLCMGGVLRSLVLGPTTSGLSGTIVLGYSAKM